MQHSIYIAEKPQFVISNFWGIRQNSLHSFYQLQNKLAQTAEYLGNNLEATKKV
jgi:hypothetical protein